LNIKKTATYDVGNPSPCLGQTQKCGRLKPVIWISNDNTGINKQSKNYTDSFPLKATIHYYKNEWQHKHGQYNSK
jgi:hypothetical protein